MSVVFVGGGHMTSALLGGLAGRKDISVVDRNDDKRRRLAAAFGAATAATLPKPLVADAVVVAVRPPQAREACAALAGHRGLVISVVAGLRTADLRKWLGGGARVVRAMPNTPSQLGAGMCFCHCGSDVGAADRRLADELFAAVGETAWLEEEKLLDAATAVSGSSPAYVYYFVDAMRRAAGELGMPPAVALPAILQAFRGAIAMLAAGDRDAAVLRAAVAVRGGTTERALAVFDERRLEETIGAAMAACAERARRIGDELSAAEDS